MNAFVADYCETWRKQPRTDVEMIVFIDNVNRMAVPCSRDMDDKAMLEHLRLFYDLALVKRGLFEFVGSRSSERVDIVHVLLPAPPNALIRKTSY
jgi:hypothetical protein